MEFKEGLGWRCCYDPETGLYTAEVGGGPNHDLYEITKEIYDHVDDPDVEWPTSLISSGRHLYMAVDDRCGPPYTVILDSDYQKICPWAKTSVSGEVWPDELTDAAVEVFASEKNNREQRRAKKQIRRIQKYEELYDEALDLVEKGNITERLKEIMEELDAYYTGSLWKSDFEDDEAGKLPDELKRGVLSEDGLYDLLEKYAELKNE